MKSLLSTGFNRELVIISSHRLIIYAICEHGEVVEVRVEDKEISKETGNIYKGKVKRIVPAVNAAFVDIGEDREAFLPLKDFCPTMQEYSYCENLKEGESVIVQVRRSAIDTKGAKISCKIALPGKYLVLLPYSSHIGVSTKIPDELKKVLREHVKELLEPFNEEHFGFIIRTSATDVPDVLLVEDFLHLKNLWYQILEQAKRKKTPSLLYEESFKVFSIIRDYACQFDKIITDDTKIYKRIKEYCYSQFPNHKIRISLYRAKKESLYSLYNLDSVLNKILGTHIWLKSGGYIVIEETEALVAIDVNSGKNCREKTLEDMAFNINLEAAEEIAKQIRLRDLGGIIVIDFIDMKDKKNMEKLLEFLINKFKADKKPVKVKGFTSLGLLELTRKKSEESLMKKLSDICFTCKGKGYTKGEGLILFEIEKKIFELRPFVKLKIIVNPKLKNTINNLISKLKMEGLIEIIDNISMPVDKYEIKRVE